MRITTERQLLAVLDVYYGIHLLRQFTEPATVSAVARRLGIPASKLNYHVGKLWHLGFLRLHHQQGRRRYFQVVATRFEVAPELSGLLGRDSVRPFLHAVVEAYLASLSDGKTSPMTLSLEGCPQSSMPGLPRAQLLTRRISGAQFEQLCQAMWAEADNSLSEDPDAPLHTVVLLGFAGTVLPLEERT